MCQCLCCGCWWCNWFDECCQGFGYSTCCCSCWLCKSKQLESFNQRCCTCCQFVGFGSVFFCIGSVCCAPQWLKMFSMKKSSKNKSYEP